MSKTTIIILVFVLVILLGVTYGTYNFLNQPVENEIVEFQPSTDEEFLAVALAEKYSKDVADVEVTINDEQGNYVKGSLVFAPGGSENSGMFLAAYDEGWQVVFDGNGAIECQALSGYEFPAEMVNECINEKGNLVILDQVYSILTNLIAFSQVEFDEIKEVEFEWNVRKDDETVKKEINGQGTTATKVSGQEFIQIESFFKDNFEVNDNNVAAGTLVALTGYQQDNLICTLSYDMDELNVELEIDEREVVVNCSQLEDAPQGETETEELNLDTDEEFKIELESNPTTGYTWQVDYDDEMIKLISQNFETDETNNKLVGVGGSSTFFFKALVAGETQITFSYLRSWEEGTDPIDKRTYKITVE